MELVVLSEAWESATTDDERAELEGVIREYLSAEVRKVDGVAAAIRRFQNWSAEASAEELRLYQRHMKWEKRAERIKAYVLQVMKTFDVKRLETPTNTLRRHGQADKVEITGDIGPEFTRITVSMRESEWNTIIEPHTDDITSLRYVSREPMKTEIASRLKVGREVAGARLLTDQEHLRIE
jgi:hypothetical protein